MEIKAKGEFNYKANGCDDYLAVSLEIKDGNLEKSEVRAEGCRQIKDVSEKIKKIIIGKKINEVMKITDKEAERLIKAKKEEVHAVGCFISALNESIADYKNKNYGKDFLDEAYHILDEYNEGYNPRALEEYEE